LFFPESAYEVSLHDNYEFDSSKLRFLYSSLVTPDSVVDYDLPSNNWDILKEEVIPSGYEKSEFTCERLFIASRDNENIPVSILYKNDFFKKDGTNSCLLTGYGAYGSSMELSFDSSRLSLLRRGFVLVISHIRGGTEMGRKWYDNGKKLNKKNSFNDFIDTAEFLVKYLFTSRDRLAIWGCSAGGLLVSTCMTMRPDLFSVVIADVPFVDAVTTMSDPEIPLTTLEYDEWGNPDENEETFNYILSYSPYDNVTPTIYPHVMITVGFNDVRVQYWEGAKFCAKLREFNKGPNLVLMKVNMGAGHSGSSGRYDYLDEIAECYTFILAQLGHLKFFAEDTCKS